MRLSNLIPSLPQDLISALETIGIRTEMDLLFSASALDMYNRLPAGSITFQDLSYYMGLAAELCAAPGASARDLWTLEDEARRKDVQLATGDEEFDLFLSGLGSRRVLELSGDSGSGKTTLAVQLILYHLAANPNHTGTYVDTTGDFSLDQASRIVETKQLPINILERFKLTFAFDLNAVQELLSTFNVMENGHTFLLVIDTITPLLGPLLSAVSAQGHAHMVEFMRQIQDYARCSSATVIIINNSAGQGPHSAERKPALGPSFSLMTDTTLWLQKITGQEEGPAYRSVQMIKSHSVVRTFLIPLQMPSF
ncbi:hypothetical protein D9619_004447 [Psilocybe cf. subviscida]|uniref:AAA+ ATPase domain-containing protein n=1 Tax=Psilocybe cf. subviscida TaxID=2480587 RepID=A0A8H5BPW3_9AGAR|nr:hypothetical protein D9619_004447 [Psilocybe cf. subviscida]